MNSYPGCYIFPQNHILSPLSEIIFFPSSRYSTDWGKYIFFIPLRIQIFFIILPLIVFFSLPHPLYAFFSPFFIIFFPNIFKNYIPPRPRGGDKMENICISLLISCYIYLFSFFYRFLKKLSFVFWIKGIKY